jgi:hypothetical protein
VAAAGVQFVVEAVLRSWVVEEDVKVEKKASKGVLRMEWSDARM